MGFRLYRIGGLFSFLPALLLTSFAVNAFAGDAVLTWGPSPSEDIIGYRVYAGNGSRIYSAPITTGNQTEYTMTGLTNGTWYFAVTAFDIEGNESDYSNEVTKTIGAVSNPDATPPVISSVTYSNVGSSGATIAWKTNEPSTSHIEFGKTTSYGSSVSNSPMLTAHSQALSGLLAGTLYHYRVKSADAAGNQAVSGDYTFSTAAAVDTTAPVISGVTYSNVTGTGARIVWTTNEASNSQVEYGTTTGYGKSTTLSSSMVTAHAQVLSGLSSGTQYHYRVISKDAAGNLAVSRDYVFATPVAADTTAPVISGVTRTNVTSTGATVAWTTNEASNSQIEYGTTTGYGKSTTLNSSMGTVHSQALSGLSAGTRYHYRVRSRDAAGNLAVSSDFTFTTAADSEDSSEFARWFRSSAVKNQADSDVEPDAYQKPTYAQANGLQKQYMIAKSLDALGQKLVSTSFLRQLDKTGPVITALSSSAISNSGATITWSTNEPADSHVDYGTTTSYELSPAVNGDMAKTHSQTLTGLKAGTQYHYRVKSADAAGNLTVSGDRTFTTTASGTAPAISAIAASDITGRSARITWSTDTPSDSEVEYLTAAGAARKAVLGEQVTQHSITLNSLEPQTRYQFTIRSTDAESFQAKSQEYSFTTSSSGISAVALPRFYDLQDENELGAEVLTQIAMTNLGGQSATLTLTAMDSEGNLVAGQNIVNPNRLDVGPQTQSATLDLDIFGEGLGLSGSKGWIKVESTTTNVGGFSLAFDSNLRFADGTSLGEIPLTDFAFTEIASTGSTRINVANDNPEDATVTFSLVRADGTVGSSQSRVIRANGALVADLFADIFTGVGPDAANYVRANSSEGVLSFELMKKESGDSASLAAQDITAGGTVLYSPHFIAGSEWKTSLSIINLDARAGKVQFRFVGENGVQIGKTRSLDIPANGKLHVDDAAFFGQDLSKIYTGYVRISSDGVRLAGSAVFGDGSGTSFSSALPLVSCLQKSVLYGHAVSNDLYRSGIAIVNPNGTGATAVVELFAADGTSIGKKSEYIQPGTRRAKLLTEYFPAQQGQDQTSGYIKITSDKPLASYSLFGTANLSVLSAIPAKTIP